MHLFDELIINVLTFCSPYNINIRLVCRRFNEMCSDTFYKKYKRDFLDCCIYIGKLYKKRFNYSLFNSKTLHKGFMLTMNNSYDGPNLRCSIIQLPNFDPFYNNGEIFIACCRLCYDVTIDNIFRYKIDNNDLLINKCYDMFSNEIMTDSQSIFQNILCKLISKYPNHLKVTHLENAMKHYNNAILSKHLMSYTHTSKLLSDYLSKKI
jgi:hypothetical protein